MVNLAAYFVVASIGVQMRRGLRGWAMGFSRRQEAVQVRGPLCPAICIPNLGSQGLSNQIISRV